MHLRRRRTTMAAVNLYFILVLFIWNCFSCINCQFNLTENSPCVTGRLNGTCVNIFKCTSASLTYLLTNAGFKVEEDVLPELPDICSYSNNEPIEPIVCCTDCDITKEIFRNYAVGPLAVLVDKTGPIAKEKCLNYFQKLPYPCRGKGVFKVHKTWMKSKKCHEASYSAVLAVGGRNAERWEFPHVALIGYGEEVASAQWLCGGSVISEKFILTAAHCAGTRALGNISFAALGILKRSDPIETWKVQKIKKIIIHPEYKAPSKYNDIALLETENEIFFDKTLLPACLDIGDDSNPTAEASGWGRLGHRNELADTLQVVELNEFTKEKCSDIYRPHRLLLHGYDHGTQMCYGSHKNIVDTCEGDSGGPLQTNKFKCLYTIVGVTSYGKNCGIPGSAGMYTRVSEYIPWIESVVWPEETEARKIQDQLWFEKWLN